MQFVLCLLASVCLVTLVKSETCTVNSDCVATACSPGNTVICQHPTGTDGIKPGGGLCTCQASTECFTRADCLGANANLPCPDSRRHCYDNKCICDRFPMGIGNQTTSK